MTERVLTATYQAVATGFTQRVDGCLPQRWASQSPCEQWTARDVALHVIANHRFLLGLPALDGNAMPDLAGAWRDAAGAMSAAIADPDALARKPGGPFGESTLEMLAGGLLLTDTLVHTWDLARATGQDDTLDAQAVERCHKWLAGLGDRIRGTGRFNTPVDPPPGADPQTAFICFTGRVV